jgi:hypothetical protein
MSEKIFIKSIQHQVRQSFHPPWIRIDARDQKKILASKRLPVTSRTVTNLFDRFKTVGDKRWDDNS